MTKKTLFLLLFFSLFQTLYAAPARSGLQVFTQPDGTKFQGYLKGDAAFHWIESDAKIVLYNPKDKFYYNAVVDANNSLVIGTTKPSTMPSSRVGFQTSQTPSEQTISTKYTKALKMMQNKAHTGMYPR